MLIAPSLLASDLTCLRQEIERVTAAGADWLHVDVMDGHFVPNIAMGPDMVRAIKSCTTLPLDVHLMIKPADSLLDLFIEAGATSLTIHPESGPHLHRTLQRIRDRGLKAGIALSPGTPIAVLDAVGDMVDLILVMTVNPGFGGQSFLTSQMPKIKAVRQFINHTNPAIHLQVDGGINVKTAPLAVAAGANVLVAGTAIFGDPSRDYASCIKHLRGDH